MKKEITTAKEIRRHKYSELAPLSDKYLSGKIDSLEFCQRWGKIAESCIDAAYKIADKELRSTYNIKEDSDFSFSVMALGKLGAEELNLSSDVDLLFLYNNESDNLSTNNPITAHEFASKLASKITAILSERGEYGFGFRVDNDLRPEGKSGALANTVSAAGSYYNYWGNEIERMMLIRARPVAGDIELGKSFIKTVYPFVYRRSWDVEKLSKIKELKDKIEKEAAKSSSKGFNIKLGEGGIREVEFITQAIQIVHGGKSPRLVTNNTVKAIDAIKKYKYLPTKQCKALKEAYYFLRHIENMVQLPEEKQTHEIPNDPKEFEKLANLAGYKDTKKISAAQQLLSDLDTYTGVVKQQFHYMFQTDFEKQQMEDAIVTNISTCAGGEEEVDSLTWFRKEETKRIQFLDLEKGLPIEDVSSRLTLVAEVVVSEAFKIAAKDLREIYGPPIKEGGTLSSLSIVGMGKLGGKEIDYASDLDIMFIFSGEGKTSGPKIISNHEYFTKLSQRIISIITLPTRYGKAYQIDADLRPSGRSGVLVSSLESFKNYHHLESDIWERQSLIKARPFAGDPRFSETVMKTIEELCFDVPLKPDFKEKILKLRQRVREERALETDSRFNIKLGDGGIMDIETIVQYLQLKNGANNLPIRTSGTANALKSLADQKLISFEDSITLLTSYHFFKGLLSRIRLFSNHATDHLDTKSDQIEQIAKTLKYKDLSSLTEKYHHFREKVRLLYNSCLST